MKCLFKLKLLFLYFLTHIIISLFIIIIIYSNRTYLHQANELIMIRNYYTKKENISIGIISNPLLNPKNKTNYLRMQNLKNALNTFKEQKVNVIIILGNIIESPDKEAYKQFNNIYSEFFPNITFPHKIFLMGEKHYKQGYKHIEKDQKNFYKFLNQTNCENLRVGEYNFIKYSYLKYKNDSNINWLKTQLSKTTYNNPIFILTSIDENNYNEINNILKYYNNLILINGNSKFSLMDERSISKNDYITINVQSMSYINLYSNEKIENGPIPIDENGNNEIAYKNPMGLILNISQYNFRFNRYFLNENKIYGEEWIIPIEFINEKTNFTDYYKKDIIPYFPDNINNDIKVKKNDNNKYIIKFYQASFKTLTCEYQIIFENEKIKQIYYYFSDYFLMPDDRNKEITLLLNNNLKKGVYFVKIYAKNCYGKFSNNFISNKIELK